MLYDDRSTFVPTIKEHLESFSRHSRHKYRFLAATTWVEGIDGAKSRPDFGFYDSLVIHYSVRLSLDDHISTGVAEMVALFQGPKLLFIQDEYENTETARGWIDRLGINAVFTNVPAEEIDKVYPQERFPSVDFLPTLTGYVPEDQSLDEYVTPMADRKVMIGYRGRKLSHQYGQLGQEKVFIGEEMRRRASEAGLMVDIELKELERIYGPDWYRFLGSCRATLGTESGANILDEDGLLRGLALRHAKMPFNEFAATYLRGKEGAIHMNQISPKIFEAIRLRTALILFEGRYSGVIEPDRHYISLKKNFSNVTDVFSKLADLTYLDSITSRAYDDVIASGRYSYSTFVNGIDCYLEQQCSQGSPVEAATGRCGDVGNGTIPATLLPWVRAESAAMNTGAGSTNVPLTNRQASRALLPARLAFMILYPLWHYLPVRLRQEWIWQRIPVGFRQLLKSLLR